jgi:hypothetical protein
MNMPPSDITMDSILDNLITAGQQANTSVMGPVDATTLSSLVTDDTDFITELHAATTKARDDNDSSELLLRLNELTARLTKQAEQERKTKAKEFDRQLKAAKQQLSSTAVITDITTARLQAAKRTFESSLKTVSDLATKISKTDKKIDRYN